MQRFFVETNDYNAIAFVDSYNKTLVMDELSFDEKLTLEYAKNADFSNFDGCKTVEDCLTAMGTDLEQVNRPNYHGNITVLNSFDELIKQDDVKVTNITKDATVKHPKKSLKQQKEEAQEKADKLNAEKAAEKALNKTQEQQKRQSGRDDR